MANVKVVVGTGGGSSYDVRVGAGIVDALGADVSSRLSPTRAFLVYDEGATADALDHARSSLRSAGIATTAIRLPEGPRGRKADCALEVWRAMADARADRRCVVVGMGGAPAVDMAGLVAALFDGGVPLVEVPTTLSCACAKCAGGLASAWADADADVPRAYIGVDAVPALCSVDVAEFDHMPPQAWDDGFARVAQAAVLGSDDFYFWLVDACSDLASHDHDACTQAVARTTAARADLKAQGAGEKAADDDATPGEGRMPAPLRRVLRYGDELANALVATRDAPDWGRAHAEGMRFSMRLACATQQTSVDLVRSQDDVLDGLGLAPLAKAPAIPELLEALRRGPYGEQGAVSFVLPLDVGRSTVAKVPDDVVRQHVAAWARAKEEQD